jgi:AraC-like DNA-binding protein
MVSIRCKMVVKDTFKKLGLHYTTVNLGEVNVVEDISPEQREKLRAMLLKSGLELLDDKRSILIERIKNVIIQMVHYEEDLPKLKFSVYLSQQLNYDYTYLANIFSETQGTTIEQFWKLHYSNVSHLSTQFKKVTGLTPSYFKALKKKRMNLLEDL